jgi:hypothetical protein
MRAFQFRFQFEVGSMDGTLSIDATCAAVAAPGRIRCPVCRIPRLRFRARRCYELAYLGAMRAHEHGEEWRIVHGVWSEYGFGHAWLVKDGTTFCPTSDRAFSEQEYRETHHAEPRIIYTREQAARLASEHGHFGPWVEGFILGS